jgi:hypothetical protein
MLDAVTEHVHYTLAQLLHRISLEVAAVGETAESRRLIKHQKLLQSSYDAFTQQQEVTAKILPDTNTNCTLSAQELVPGLRAKISMTTLANCFKEMVHQYESADETLLHINRLLRFEQVCVKLDAYVPLKSDDSSGNCWADEAQGMFVNTLRNRVKALAQERLGKHEYKQGHRRDIQRSRSSAANSGSDCGGGFNRKWLHMHQNQRQRYHAVQILVEAFEPICSATESNYSSAPTFMPLPSSPLPRSNPSESA